MSRYSVFNSELKYPDKIRVSYDDGGLNVKACKYDETPVFNIDFEDVLLAKICPESVRLKLVAETENYKGLILIDKESDLTQWLSEQALDIPDMQTYTHYILFLGREVLEVISSCEPILTTT